MLEDTNLFKAITNNASFGEIKSIIESGADLKETNSDGLDILAYAVMKHNDPEVIKLLVSKGISFFRQYNNGWNLAHFAAQNPNPQIMQLLMNNGVKYRTQEQENGRNPLMLACISGSPEVCKLLIRKEHDLRARDKKGYNPIILAAMYNNIEVLRYLLSISSSKTVNKDILKWAKFLNNPETAKEIAENIIPFFNDKKQSYTSILDCCSNHNVLEIFDEYGFNLLNKSSVKENFFSYALSYNHNPEIIDYLIKNNIFIKYFDLIFSSIVNNTSVGVWKRLLEIGISKISTNSEGRSLLMELMAKEPNPNFSIIDLLTDERTININDNYGKNICHYAVLNKNLDYIKYFKNKGANIDERANNGVTPLMIACHNNPDIEFIDYLIENGASIHKCDSQGNNALFWAMGNSNLDIVKHLIDLGADVHINNKNGENILMEALKNGADIEKIKYIISLGIDIKEKNNQEFPTTYYAARYNPHLDVLEYLVDNGVDINFKTDKNENLAFFAADNKNAQIIYYLIKKGLDVNCRSLDGLTPILEAARSSNFYVVCSLLGKADLYVVDNNGRNLLHYICKYFPSDFYKIYSKTGYNINHFFYDLLMEYFSIDYCSNDYLKVFSNVLPLNIKDIYGNTPAMYAAQNFNYYTFKLNINYGFGEINNNGDNVLMLALKAKNNLEMIEFFSHASIVNNRNMKNETALMIAAMNYTDSKCVELLLETGADANAVDDNGNTAYDLAVKNNPNPEIAKTIEKYMDISKVNNNKAFCKKNKEKALCKIDTCKSLCIRD